MTQSYLLWDLEHLFIREINKIDKINNFEDLKEAYSKLLFYCKNLFAFYYKQEEELYKNGDYKNPKYISPFKLEEISRDDHREILNKFKYIVNKNYEKHKINPFIWEILNYLLNVASNVYAINDGVDNCLDSINQLEGN